MRCPNCGKPSNLHRSKRKTNREKILSWALMLRPYRCHSCNHRFWRPRFVSYKPPGQRRRRRSRPRSRGGR